MNRNEMLEESFYLQAGETPIVTAAIHSGHEVRAELKPLFNLSETQRLREEDPHTDWLAAAAPSRIIVNRSRFEVDLNRERDLAVYRSPEDAWGLKVWKEPLDKDVINRSLALYDKFYGEVKKFLASIVDKYGFVVIFDLHTYNHRREGTEAPPADPAANPDVNLGTANLNRDLWGPVVEGVANDLRSFDFPGEQLDVRENVRFRGGHFSRWVFNEFGNRSCAIAIEFKKIFMDEWSNQYDQKKLTSIRNVLQLSVSHTLGRSRAIAEKSIGNGR